MDKFNNDKTQQIDLSILKDAKPDLNEKGFKAVRFSLKPQKSIVGTKSLRPLGIKKNLIKK